MSEDWASELVIGWLSRHTGRDAREITSDRSLADILGDSLDLVEFVMLLEDDLSLDLPEPEGKLETVGDLIEWVRLGR